MKVDNVDLVEIMSKELKVKEIKPQKYFKAEVINPKLAKD